jgi:twitching motility protein PilT
MEVAHALRLLLQQRLVPKADGHGRVAAFEQLVHTAQLAQLIRDDQLQQLPAVLAASKSAGMVSLDDALDELTKNGSVTAAAAHAAARRGAHFRA